MKLSKKQAKIESGLFIPKEILNKANITDENIEIELKDKEIRVYTTKKRTRKIFTLDSPLWECVGFAEAEGISGRNHDKYIYNEEK